MSPGAHTAQATPTVGVDPGGRTTGVVLVDQGGALLAHAQLTRKERVGDGSVSVAYVDRVIGACRRLVDECAAAGEGAPLVAVEDVRRPVPQAGSRPTNPAGIIAASWVAGAVIEWARAAGLVVDVVEPAGHGAQTAAAYPAALRRHERSAWDVAMTARLPLRRHLHHAARHLPGGATESA